MLAINGVSVSFNRKRVLDDVTIDVARGSFVSFLGPSGCGKTTLLRLIAGFLTPDSGGITLDGKPLSTASHIVPPEKRGMGMVFQNYAVWPHMSVYQNVAYGLRLRRLPKDIQRTRARKALELVNLSKYEDRSPTELSGGQQQRVAIARSIAIEPNVLLLDEPLSNLDVALRRELLFDLKRIQQASGITFVYVTHDQGEALSVSDKVVVLDQGRVRQAGSPALIYNDPADLFVASFVGHSNVLSGTVEQHGDHGLQVLLSDEARISLPGRCTLSAGTACRLAVKRHGIKFGLAPNGASSQPACKGTVLRTFFVGDYDEVAVSIGDQCVYGFAVPNLLKPGDPVSVHFEAASCHVFAP
jgi:iron(III) transport system ATP-binding protein